MTDADDSLISHLEALRTLLIRCLAALGVGILPMYAAAPYTAALLLKVMIGENDILLNYFSPLEVFILQIKIALVLDLLLCFPYIALQVWKFILPALYPGERRFIKSIVLSSSVLFIIGVSFCLFFILPLLVNFGLSFSSPEIKAVWGISNLISTALWLSVVFGIMFQFPLITYSLIRSNIVSLQAVRQKRPYVLVGILIISALLTPPDVVSQLMLTVPTYLLFEAGVFWAGSKRCPSDEAGKENA